MCLVFYKSKRDVSEDLGDEDEHEHEADRRHDNDVMTDARTYV